MEQQKRTQPPPIEPESIALTGIEEIEPDYTPLSQEEIDDNPFFKLGRILDEQGYDAAVEWVREQMQGTKES
jgi:hypothetical protein